MQATARLLGQTIGAAMVALMFGLFPESGTRESLVFAAVAAAGAALVSFSRLTGKRGRSGQPSHT
jgi:DHA2 family multidrug resistance protein-like MFS transporter